MRDHDRVMTQIIELYFFLFYTCTVETNIEDGVDFTTRMRKNLVFSAQAHTEGGVVLLHRKINQLFLQKKELIHTLC